MSSLIFYWHNFMVNFIFVSRNIQAGFSSKCFFLFAGRVASCPTMTSIEILDLFFKKKEEHHAIYMLSNFGLNFRSFLGCLHACMACITVHEFDNRYLWQTLKRRMRRTNYVEL